MRTNTSNPVRSTATWTAADIPSQNGRLAVVTGTGGIGYEVSLALARAGAEVVVAGRNPQKGASAVERIRNEAPRATVRYEVLDLASLRSVEKFAEGLREKTNRIDLLVNNAGVMTPPKREVTKEGFELQFGTNYLGHFSLTAALLPLLTAGSSSRVVTLSSVAARQGRIDFSDIQAEREYNAMKVYSQSKLACLMFAFELQRRSEEGGWGIASMGAHPGISRTDMIYNGAGRSSIQGVIRTLFPFLFQPADQGALPALFAATSPLAKAGGYYGPSRMSEMRGGPAEAVVPKAAQNLDDASRLWELSERLTGRTFPTVKREERLL